MFFNWNRDREEKEILKVKQGDASAMRNLYEEHIGCLTAVCSRYVVNEDDVKDVLQESFIRIFASVGKFEYRGKGSVRAWLTRVVVNESLGFLKKSPRLEVAYPDSELPDRAEEEGLDVASIPPEAIQEMVQQLPKGYRTVFNLYVFEQKSHKEIAGLLGIKPDSSASQLHKAKEQLSRMIKDYKMRNYG